MNNEGSISAILTRLKEGNNHDSTRAIEEIWNRCHDQLTRLARRKLGGLPRRMEDEEDLVQSGFMSFVQARQEGRYPNLRDRRALWRLLARIIGNKAKNRRSWHRAGKRTPENGKIKGNSGLDWYGLHVPAPEPTPAVIVEAIEQVNFLLGILEDESLRAVVLLRLDGYTNAEIAKRMNVSERAVERKLARIRDAWAEKFNPCSGCC